jgi:hypothetical protein
MLSQKLKRMAKPSILMLSQESKIADGLAKISSCKAWWVFRGEGIHQYVEVLKKRRNAAGRTFCDAIKVCHVMVPTFLLDRVRG